jgi:hypothetical protein
MQDCRTFLCCIIKQMHEKRGLAPLDKLWAMESSRYAVFQAKKPTKRTNSKILMGGLEKQPDLPG